MRTVFSWKSVGFINNNLHHLHFSPKLGINDGFIPEQVIVSQNIGVDLRKKNKTVDFISTSVPRELTITTNHLAQNTSASCAVNFSASRLG